jgi:hypothetical protein
MDTNENFAPIQVALKYVASCCIDEDMLQEAETMTDFLDLSNVAPRTVGLLRIWILSQKGHLRESYQPAIRMQRNIVRCWRCCATPMECQPGMQPAMNCWSRRGRSLRVVCWLSLCWMAALEKRKRSKQPLLIKRLKSR